jgi:hypothetical protein
MPRGSSGRIVLEIEPSIKKELYSALDIDAITLKRWFLNEVLRYLKERGQLSLFENEKVSSDKR